MSHKSPNPAEAETQEPSEHLPLGSAASSSGAPTAEAQNDAGDVNSEGPRVLIMKGGGIKGLAYVGALRELEGFYNFNWFVGTSAGAIAAVLLAAGYTTAELEKELGETDFKEFFDAPFYKLPVNYFADGGLYTGVKIEEWLNKLLKSKLEQRAQDAQNGARVSDEPTLKQINVHSRVTIYASTEGQDEEGKSVLEFDSGDVKDEDTPAAYAVRCSMSIPYVFQPQSRYGKAVFDGGLQNNYPVLAFLDSHPGTKFIGLYLLPAKSSGKTSTFSKLLSILTESADRQALSQYAAETVVIDPSPIGTLQFGLSPEEKDFLLKAGRSAALRFLLNQKRGDGPPLEDVEKAEEQTRLARAVVNRLKARRRTVRRALGVAALVALASMIWHLPYVWNLFGPSTSRDAAQTTVTPHQCPGNEDYNAALKAHGEDHPDGSEAKIDALKRAREFYTRALDSDDCEKISILDNRANALEGLADATGERRYREEAVEDYSRALKFLETGSTSDTVESSIPAILLSRGHAKEALGDVDGARSDFGGVCQRGGTWSECAEADIALNPNRREVYVGLFIGDGVCLLLVVLAWIRR